MPRALTLGGEPENPARQWHSTLPDALQELLRMLARQVDAAAVLLISLDSGAFEVTARHGSVTPVLDIEIEGLARRLLTAGHLSLERGELSTGLYWAQGVTLPTLRGPATRLLLTLGSRPLARSRDPHELLTSCACLAAHLIGLERSAQQLDMDVRAQRASVRAARDTEQLLIDYLLTATDGVWQTDAEHRFVSTTTDLSSIQVSQERVYGRTAWELAGGDPDRDALWAELRGHFGHRRPFRGFEYSLRDDSGEVIWREVNGNPVFAHDGSFVGFRGTSRNITDRKQAEVQLREMNSRLAALSQSGLVGIIIGEGEWIVETNDEFLRIIGFERADMPDGKLHRRSIAPSNSYSALVAEFDPQGVWGPAERELLRKDGNRIPVLVSSILLDRGCARWMCLVQDISERKRAEARIRELADRDTLTGLSNRRSFMERFADLLRHVPRRTAGGALILFDLDHFKDVNDTLGHDAGDALLCEVSARLNKSVRQHDTVARLGGDEFAVLIHDILEAEEVDAITRRILEHLRKPFEHDGRLIYASASAGVVLFPADGSDVKQLLKNADIALYRSKSRGRRTVNFFDPHMLAEYEDRLALDTDLQQAFAEREFTLAYQPTVRLEDGSHAGFEALLRWQHPVRGLLSPASFIANLEQSGLIVPVGRFVLEAALAQMRAWLDLGFQPGQMALNFAAAQLRQSDLVAEVGQHLALNRLTPTQLRVEITENVLLEDSPEIQGTLAGLHRLGVSIALDDFGTGFASLAHLKKVPVNVLKIDRSFVRDIGIDADDAAISRTIITLAHSLGMKVVAEGVTTEDALAFLRLHACDEGQGYLFARPLLAGETMTYMRKSAAMAPRS